MLFLLLPPLREIAFFHKWVLESKEFSHKEEKEIRGKDSKKEVKMEYKQTLQHQCPEKIIFSFYSHRYCVNEVFNRKLQNVLWLKAQL